MSRKRTNYFLLDSTEFFPGNNLATVVKSFDLQRRVRVKFQGTEWFARFHGSDAFIDVSTDTPVRVVGREGIILLIAPISTSLVVA